MQSSAQSPTTLSTHLKSTMQQRSPGNFHTDVPEKAAQMSELSAASFPTLLHRPFPRWSLYRRRTAGGMDSPTGLFSYKVGLTLFDSTGSNSAEVEQHVGGNVLNTMLTLQPITSTGTQFTPVGNYWFIKSEAAISGN